MTVAFFHQNTVAGVQGGIERYLATLLAYGGERCVLVSETGNNLSPQICGVELPALPYAPQWLRFVIGVWRHVKKIRLFLRTHGVTASEFSRPEYVLFSFLFAGKKVFTLHGTGPSPSERGKYLIHHAACWFLPLCADEIRIVGRDASGLPALIRHIMDSKISTIDAWFDPCFTPVPYPANPETLRVFYAGRLAKMKNPDLLFDIIRLMKNEHGPQISFHYFGSDGEKIPADLRHKHMTDHGLLSAADLATAIQSCHIGVLCSKFGEGSPFIIVETLACGRGYVLPPLQGLKETYNHHSGVRFADDYEPESFARCIIDLGQALRSGLMPENIAQSVANQSQSRMAQVCIERLHA